MNALLEQFLAETRECLQGIGEKLLELERQPDSTELINELFRLVHTLKGNSGLFDFPEMTRVLHAGEDLMDAVRNGKAAYSMQLTDCLLEMLDFVDQLSDEIAETEKISAGHMDKSTAISQRLRQLLPQEGNGPAGGAEAAAGHREQQLALPPEIPQGCLQGLAAELQEGNPLFLVTYTPEAGCFFKGEDPFFQFRQVPNVRWCSITPNTPFASGPEFDPYDCKLKFRAICQAELAELQTLFRYVPEQVLIEPVAPGDLCLPTPVPEASPAIEIEPAVAAESSPAPAAAPAFVPDVETLISLVESQVAVLSLEDQPQWMKGRLNAAANTVKACLAHDTTTVSHAQVDEALELSLQAEKAAPLLALCNEILKQLRAPQAAPVESACPPAPVAAASQAVPAQPQARAEPVASAAAETATAGTPISKILKVDQEKIDRLMSLIGEIVVAKNSLPYLANRAENHYGNREIGREIKAQYAVINRIAEEMQDAIMQVRMMPVSTVLQRFPRLVRDISKKLGKEVELIVEGEDTEIDKNIVEALADPLIHIVRNSLDHGLEMPAVRLAAGKPALGKITIKARQESDRVFIDIADDGKGVNPTIVKQKAYEKGLIDEALLERISDQDAVNLIFAAGFSTSETVSDLSGRGVGMDVVRNAIVKVNGSINLQSQVGKGTQIRLSLPLSMAVTNVMIVESNNQVFGIPMDSVVETVRLNRAEIHGIKQHKTAVLRGEVIPLLELNQLLSIDKAQQVNEQNEIATLVIRHDGENVGLVVDNFRETVDIILKPMNGILSSLAVYSGSALMGDGSVLMVLNPRELI